jgi:hypothetical protein
LSEFTGVVTTEPGRVSNFRDVIIKKTLDLDLNVDTSTSSFENFQLRAFALRNSMHNTHRIRILMVVNPSTNQRVSKIVSPSFC